MSVRGKHSPISDEEAEEFALRIATSDNVEIELAGEEALQTQTMWEDFVASRIQEERGVEATGALVNMANRGRRHLLRRAIRMLKR